MKKIFFLLSLPILLLVGCTKDGGTDVTEYMPNFIDAYFPYNDYVVQIPKDYQLMLTAKTDVNEWFWLKSTDETKRATFTALSIKNNDISFNRYITFGWGLAAYNVIPDTDINTINIVSSEYIDEQHPAGASLNDLFQLVAVSPRDFICNNYTPVISDERIDSLMRRHDFLFTNRYFSPCYSPIIKPLEVITEYDLRLMGSGDIDILYLFALEPKDKFNCPAYGKALTITLTYEDKEPISKTFIYTKGEY